MTTRKLKIEAVGDAWKGKIHPKIRLCGYWLERAGFKPGHHVQVKLTQPGQITLEFQASPGIDQTPVDNSSPGVHAPL
jgi:hypothetical protein